MPNEHKKNLLVIKASAGSGKTYTLAKLYIELLLWQGHDHLDPKLQQPAYHQHILAITFTKKATAEMKSRIVNELFNLSNGTCAYMNDYLRDHPADSPEAIKQAAQKALDGIMFGYNSFNVSTIDSFFQTVLRSFTHELDQDADYELQLDEKYAMRQAVHSFFASLADGRNAVGKSGVLAWMRDMLNQRLDDGDDWNLFNGKSMSSMLDFSRVINKENFRSQSQEIIKYLTPNNQGEGRSPLLRFKKAVINAANQCADEVATGKYSHTAFQQLLARHGNPELKSTIAALAQPHTVNDKVNETIAGYTLEDMPSKCIAAKLPASELSSLSQDLYDFKQGYVFTVEAYRQLHKLDQNLWLLGLLREISAKLQEYRLTSNTMLISDTNDLIARVLDSGVPFVFERTGTWLNHFMIDEFQDTSRKQYDNFRPLLENSLADDHGNLIIGDEKQSIYRFRNSDPDLLQVHLPHDFAHDYDDERNRLTVNYRTYDRVVDFNNALFQAFIDYFKTSGSTSAVVRDKLVKTYETLKQEHGPQSEKDGRQGSVEVHFHTGKLADLLTDTQTLDDNDKMEVKPDMTLAQKILQLRDKWDYQFRDIMILVNTNKEGEKVVRGLLEHNMRNTDPARNINVVSEESLLLVNSPSVNLIVNVLRFVNATRHTLDDDTAAGGAVPTPISTQKLSDQYAHKVLHDFATRVASDRDQTPLGELLKQSFEQSQALRHKSPEAQLKDYSDSIKSLMPDPATEPFSLVALVDKIIDQYVVKVNQNAGRETDTLFIQAFQDVVLEFMAQHGTGGSITEFLQYWDSNKDKLTIPSGDDADAVNVMTVHKAKGLEAPCVIVPNADWKMQPSMNMSKDNNAINEVAWMERGQWMNGGEPFMGIGANNPEMVPPLIPVTRKFIDLFGGDGQSCQALCNLRQETLRDNLIDQMNKTYVAFTRPRQHLIVYAPVSKNVLANEAAQPSTVGEFLYRLLPGLEGNRCEQQAVEIKESKSKKKIAKTVNACVRFGEIEHCFHKADVVNANESKEEMPSYTVNAGLHGLTVQIPPECNNEQHVDTRLHRVLSLIRHADDRDRALRYARARHVLPDEPDQQSAGWCYGKLEACISQMLTNPKYAWIFDKKYKVYNERSFVHTSKHCRPDRVMVGPDGEVVLIDYKLGKSGQLQSNYEKDVRKYARLLKRGGHTRIKAWLWYLNSGELQPVDLTKHEQDE